uniref:Uncharacterized protein n=1 Tax=Megaselia scalaris TaxID=36166 RepID=T1GN70_MEGSC
MVVSSGERHQTKRSRKLDTISQEPRSMGKMLLYIGYASILSLENISSIAYQVLQQQLRSLPRGRTCFFHRMYSYSLLHALKNNTFSNR